MQRFIEDAGEDKMAHEKVGMQNEGVILKGENVKVTGYPEYK